MPDASPLKDDLDSIADARLTDFRSIQPMKPQMQRRVKWVIIFTAAFIGIILLKILYIQVWDAPNLQRKSQQLRNHSLVLYHRGRILDRNQVVMAQDTFLYDVYLHPQYFGEVTSKQIAEVMSPILNVPEATLIQQIGASQTTIRLMRNLSKDLMDRLRAVRISTVVTSEEDPEMPPQTRKVPIPGLDIVKKSVRAYPQGTLAAHLLGYVNDEANLSSGIEEVAKKVLRSQPIQFAKKMELDGRGNPVDLASLNPSAIVNVPTAQDVTLTIDSRIQHVAERELALGLEKNKAKRGAVIALNPKTGEVLAFAVEPSYEPESFLKYPSSSWTNWALTDVYPPGSTFKILTVASGLESGVIEKDSQIQDTGVMDIGGWKIKNADFGRTGAPGWIDLVYLFQHSSNIASAKISLKIPKQQHEAFLKRFGFGVPTGIDLPGESAGIFQGSEGWDETTHATLGFGYGLAATPLQMASAIATIANGGVWVTPHVMKSPIQKPLLKRRVVSEKTAHTMTELLATSLENAKHFNRLHGIRVAGKTGTSWRPKDNGQGYDRTKFFTSFVGYFPVEDPKMLLLVVVDSPASSNAFGSTVAAPIFKAIGEEVVRQLKFQPSPPPEKRQLSLAAPHIE